MALALEGLRVIDADTHLSEAHDLWTSRSPAKFKDRVPHVEMIDGRPMWIVDGAELGFAGGGGVIDRDGNKGRALEALYEWTQDQTHLGAVDPDLAGREGLAQPPVALFQRQRGVLRKDPAIVGQDASAGDVRAQQGGLLIYLKDVGRIELGKFTFSGNSFVDGSRASFLMVYQAPGSNALQTADNVYAELEQLKKFFYLFFLKTPLAEPEGSAQTRPGQPEDS